MDKLLFFFHRKDGLTRDEFLEHYLDLTRRSDCGSPSTMDGYTVNLVDTEGADGRRDHRGLDRVGGRLLRPGEVVRDRGRRQGADDRPRLVHRSVRHLHRRGAGRAPGAATVGRAPSGCRAISRATSVPEAGPDVTVSSSTAWCRCSATDVAALHDDRVHVGADRSTRSGRRCGVSFDVREYRKKTPPS